MKTVSFNECDSPDEVCKLFNRVFADLELLNVKLIQVEKKMDAKPEKKVKSKKSGFARLGVLLAVVMVFSIGACAELWPITYDNCSNPESLTVLLQNRLGITGSTYTFGNGLTIDNATNNVFEWNENSEDLLWTFGTNLLSLTSTTGVVKVNFGAVVPAGNQFLMNPVADKVGSVEGTLYYDSDDDNLYLTTTAGQVDLTAAAGSITDFDTAYNGGSTVDVDTDAITLTVSDTDNNLALIMAQNDTTNNPNVVQITNAGTGIGLDIDGQAAGRDIEGTGATWYVTGAGEGTFSSVSSVFTSTGNFTLESAETIGNATNSEIAFTENSGEDFIFDMDAGTNAIGLKSSTGVDELAMGAVDDLTGVGTIVFDAAASTITLASDGVAQDLTLSVTGAQNSSLVLVSSGTGADALTVSTSAGGMDVTVAGAAAGEDLDLLSNTSINLTANEAAMDDAIVIATGGAGSGMQITSLADIDITTTGAAGEDISLTNTGGSINLTATESAVDSIVISSSVGGIDITAAGGAATEDIDILATSSSINIDAGENAASAITLTTGAGATGGTSETIVITNTDGTSANAITVNAAAGGINVDALDDIDLTVTAGGAGEDLLLTATGAQDTAITLTSSGTGDDAIGLVTTAGGININMSGGAAGEDFEITTATSIDFSSSEAAADQFKMDATGTVAGNAINLETTDGGIVFTADGAANGDITIDAEDVISLTSANAAGILASTNAKTLRYETFGISQGVTAASEVIVGNGGQGLICTSLDAGVNEAGATTGYATVGDDEDILIFWVPLPDTWVDTGTQTDLVLQFYISEQAAEECNMDVRIFEFNNTTPILSDTLLVANGAGAGWVNLVTNATGIGNDADVDADDNGYIVEVTATADTDDFRIYGARWKYRVGLQATQ